MTVSEVLARHTSDELTEWAGYFRLLNRGPEDVPVSKKLSEAFGNG